MKFKWTKIEQDAFDKIKWNMPRDPLLDYPDFNEEFKFHNDESDFQLGVVISHKVNLTAF